MTLTVEQTFADDPRARARPHVSGRSPISRESDSSDIRPSVDNPVRGLEREIRLDRAELYERVWSQPVSKLGAAIPPSSRRSACCACVGITRWRSRRTNPLTIFASDNALHMDTGLAIRCLPKANG